MRATSSTQSGIGSTASAPLTPAVWVRRWRTVTPAFPPAAKAGRCSATGSSSDSAPASQAIATRREVATFVIDIHGTTVDGTIGTPGRASPTASEAAGSASRVATTQAAGCRPSDRWRSRTASVRGRSLTPSGPPQQRDGLPQAGRRLGQEAVTVISRSSSFSLK
jgi:hypothetical protein